MSKPYQTDGQMIKKAILIEKDKALSKDERDNEIKEIFAMFDKNGDGKLLNTEIESFMIAIGQKPTKEEVDELVTKMDADKNGYITIDEFLAYMDDTYVISQDQIDELIDAFKIFDIDNSGNISKEEFKNILTRYGKAEFSDEDIDDIFSMIDIDHDGTINYAEFINMWKYQ